MVFPRTLVRRLSARGGSDGRRARGLPEGAQALEAARSERRGSDVCTGRPAGCCGSAGNAGGGYQGRARSRWLALHGETGGIRPAAGRAAVGACAGAEVIVTPVIESQVIASFVMQADIQPLGFVFGADAQGGQTFHQGQQSPTAQGRPGSHTGYTQKLDAQLVGNGIVDRSQSVAGETAQG